LGDNAFGKILMIW